LVLLGAISGLAGNYYFELIQNDKKKIPAKGQSRKEVVFY
jgi:hypothetical protein